MAKSKKDSKDIFNKMLLACISVKGKHESFTSFDGIHYAESQPVIEATNGKRALKITSNALWKKEFAGKIIDPKTQSPIEGNFPDINDVIPSLDNYVKIRLSIHSWIGKLINQDLIDLGLIIQKHFNGDAVINLRLLDDNQDYLFVLPPEHLSVFAGYTVDLYYNPSNSKNSPIVIKVPELLNYVEDMIYVCMPMDISKRFRI